MTLISCVWLLCVGSNKLTKRAVYIPLCFGLVAIYVGQNIFS